MTSIRFHFIACCFLVSMSDVLATPVVNELMANNQTTLADPEGEFDDWVEIHNPDGSDFDLEGYFVSDDADDLTKWQIGSGQILPADGYTLFWLDRDEEDGSPHLPFQLSAGGDEFILTAPDGVTVLDQVVLPEQHPDISYGRSPDHGGQFRYLINPTPGAENDSLGVSVLEGITFSHQQGAFIDPFDLKLETTSDGATIRYALDGTIPNGASVILYSSPITISNSTCLRVRLFFGDTPISPVETRVFLATDGTLAGFGSNLPIVLIDSREYDYSSDSDPRTDYPAQAVCAGFYEIDGRGRAGFLDAPQFIGRAGMNVRGASSKTWPKKQFKFETWNEEDEARDVSLLGMPADSDWILHAPYFDKSLMRNDFVYHFWEQLGYYSPRTRFVEVFLNPNPDEAFSMDHYRGVYVLTEKIKRSPDRMDVIRLDSDDISEPEITGGYIAQATNLNQDWVSGDGIRYKYVEPSPNDSLPVQKTWLRNYVEETENSIFAGNFADPVNGYAKYLDVPSQIDYDIMRELSRNADGASTFFSIERGEKLKMGPLWDYNQALGLSSLGAAGHGNSWETSGWNTYYMRAGHWLKWWDRLGDDPNYQRAWSDRWVSLRESTLSSGKLLGRIDSIAALLEESQVRNFEKWDILGAAVWTPNGKTRADPGDLGRDTYAKEIAFLRNWVEDRVAWIDTQVPSPPDFNQKGGSVPTGFQLLMTEGVGFQAFTGEIYYTENGLDPADPGVVATLYSGPHVLNENVRLMARTKNAGGDWSALREASFFVGAEAPGSASLTISEIHYNPNGSDDLEFIEIANRGNQAVNLTGVRLSSAVEFTFGEVDLLPGGAVVVVEDEEVFRAVFATPESPDYVDGIFIGGQWSGRLSNAGESIDLRDAVGNLLHRVTYDQDGDWPEEADGNGFTLQQKGLDSDPSYAEGWSLSTFENGTPGTLPILDPLTFLEWQLLHFTAGEIAQPEVSGMFADPDRDQRSNLLEFGLAGNPLVNESGELPQFEVESIELDGVVERYFTLTFDRPVGSELRYALLKSSKLSDWRSRPLIRVRSSVNLATQVETLTVRESQPIAVEDVYFRIQVSR